NPAEPLGQQGTLDLTYHLQFGARRRPPPVRVNAPQGLSIGLLQHTGLQPCRGRDRLPPDNPVVACGLLRISDSTEPVERSPLLGAGVAQLVGLAGEQIGSAS